VLLNRAPTLHRMGIQAFEPVLVEGNAIRVHPLVCAGFNADFDGDQMAVHLPLSFEAQVEACTLMLSTNNIFSPAHGGPIIAPNQDIVLGCYFLSLMRPGEAGEGRAFAGTDELWLAYSTDKVHVHAKIRVWIEGDREIRTREKTFVTKEGGELVETTPGRVIFNEILAPEMPFYNFDLDKKALSNIIADCHIYSGRSATLKLLDDLKAIGFWAATRAGLSFGKDDMLVPPTKDAIIGKTQGEVEKIMQANAQGLITEGERYLEVIDAWTHAREKIGEDMLSELRNDTRDGKPYVNPIFCMVMSKARGSVEQIRQLAGMRGLMAKPSGKIIESPIKRELPRGTARARVLLVDARRAQGSRRYRSQDGGLGLPDAQARGRRAERRHHDRGLRDPERRREGHVYQGDKVAVPFVDAVRGRVTRQTVVDHATGEVVVEENDLVTVDVARRIEQVIASESILVRSPLTCEAPLGVCVKCYGMDLSRNAPAEPGLAVGIIAAQSIGEPGTQLTMRTFHIGGTASKKVEESEIKCKRGGRVRFANLSFIKRSDGNRVVLKRKGEILLVDQKDREIERYAIPMGAVLQVEEDQEITAHTVLCSWDPHHSPILAEVSGTVRFEDILEGKTFRVERDSDTARANKVIIEHKGDLHPQIIIEDASGQRAAIHPLPEKAYIDVEDGDTIEAGILLAKTPREIQGTQDITGGLPRVTELFEARNPKDPAVLAEIEGIVEIGDKKRGKRTIIVRGEGGMERSHLVPQSKNLRVHRGDHVSEGEPLCDGPRVPHDILAIEGEKALQNYLLREIQSVYRAQGVSIDDKHIEIIIAQMMRKVQVNDPGDSEFLPGAIVDKYRFRSENADLIRQKKKPATSSALLMGITKASLQSESFISAASFQETTKVLTEAALAGKRDNLVGLKENVILGHLVPTGTGFREYVKTRVQKNVDLVAAAEEIGRLNKQGGFLDAGGPVLRLEQEVPAGEPAPEGNGGGGDADAGA
jgi:DNA-directed RNA polymerase subunit beta'